MGNNITLPQTVTTEQLQHSIP